LSRASISLFFSSKKFMRKKICVIGNGVKIAQDLADVGNDLRGADVVVLAGEADLEDVRDNAPAAAILVAGDEERCREVFETTLFPRGRIIGIARGQAQAAADSIIFEKDDEHDVIAMADGEFAPRRVRLGRGGITEVL
jgi:hypothetical protein